MSLTLVDREYLLTKGIKLTEQDTMYILAMLLNISAPLQLFRADWTLIYLYQLGGNVSRITYWACWYGRVSSRSLYIYASLIPLID